MIESSRPTWATEQGPAKRQRAVGEGQGRGEDEREREREEKTEQKREGKRKGKLKKDTSARKIMMFPAGLFTQLWRLTLVIPGTGN